MSDKNTLDEGEIGIAFTQAGEDGFTFTPMGKMKEDPDNMPPHYIVAAAVYHYLQDDKNIDMIVDEFYDAFDESEANE